MRFVIRWRKYSKLLTNFYGSISNQKLSLIHWVLTLILNEIECLDKWFLWQYVTLKRSSRTRQLWKADIWILKGIAVVLFNLYSYNNKYQVIFLPENILSLILQKILKIKSIPFSGCNCTCCNINKNSQCFHCTLKSISSC